MGCRRTLANCPIRIRIWRPEACERMDLGAAVGRSGRQNPSSASHHDSALGPTSDSRRLIRQRLLAKTTFRDIFRIDPERPWMRLAAESDQSSSSLVTAQSADKNHLAFALEASRLCLRKPDPCYLHQPCRPQTMYPNRREQIPPTADSRGD